MRCDENERDISQMFYIAEALDDGELVDKDSVEIARLRLIQNDGLLHRVDDGDLETELLYRLDDTRIVMKRIDEKNSATWVRDQSPLSNLIKIPFSDPAVVRRFELTSSVSYKRHGEERIGAILTIGL